MNRWSFVFLAVLLAGGYYWLGAAALAAFFVVGGWPFWGLLAAAVVTAWVLEEKYDDGLWPVVPFAVFCLVVHFVSQFDLVAWGKDHLGYLATRAWQYVAAGIVYSMTRWTIHLFDKRREVDNLEAAFRGQEPFDGPLNAQPVAVRLKFTEFVRRSKYSPDLPSAFRERYDPSKHGLVPQFARSALTNFRRVWWWPFSLPSWFLNELFRKAWERVKELMQKIADGIAGLIFGDRGDYVVTEAQVQEYRRNRQDPPPPAGGLDEDDDSSLGDFSPAPRRTT